jgi:hypothetical protein
MKNFEKNPHNYKNNSIKTINPKIRGTTSQICNQIFHILREYYTSEEGVTRGFECLTIARLFFWALQEYVEPPLQPEIIQHQVLMDNKIQPINDNQVMIIKFSSPVAEYHYIVVCKEHTNYRVYSAFGANFITPFLVPEPEFIHKCNQIILGDFNIRQNRFKKNLDTLPFSIPWKTITGLPLDEYIKASFLQEVIRGYCTRLLDEFEDAVDPDLLISFDNNLHKLRYSQAIADLLIIKDEVAPRYSRRIDNILLFLRLKNDNQLRGEPLNQMIEPFIRNELKKYWYTEFDSYNSGLHTITDQLCILTKTEQ